MVGSPASDSQPQAGGLHDTAHLHGLLQELRRGERDAFVGYFQLLRAQVYGFALHLLGDESAAVAVTTEAFVAAFREIILDEDAADLEVVTFRQALDACVDRAGRLAEDASADAGGRGETPPAYGRLGDIVVLTGAALGSLGMRRRAALLLHDVHGLSIVQMAAVFSVTTEAAGAQLFRARETFQQALVARSTDLPGGTCRQAEQAAAGAVGQGLGDDELRRVRRHTAYCRTCRAVMKSWGGAPIGLAVLLKQPPMPQALAAAPVFGAGMPAGEALVAAGTGVLGRILRPVGRVLRSRSAAYVVAAACIALAVGVAFRQEGVRQFVLSESVGPAIRLVIAPPGDVAQPVKGRDAVEASARPSPHGSAAASGPAASSQPLEVVSQPASQASSGGDARLATRTDASDTAMDAARSDAPAAGASSAVGEGRTAKAARPVVKGRQDGTKHHGHRARPTGGKHDAHVDGHRPSGKASGAHASHGGSHQVRAHASGHSPGAAHRQGSAERKGHKHAKKDH